MPLLPRHRRRKDTVFNAIVFIYCCKVGIATPNLRYSVYLCLARFAYICISRYPLHAQYHDHRNYQCYLPRSRFFRAATFIWQRNIQPLAIQLAYFFAEFIGRFFFSGIYVGHTRINVSRIRKNRIRFADFIHSNCIIRIDMLYCHYAYSFAAKSSLTFMG